MRYAYPPYAYRLPTLQSAMLFTPPSPLELSRASPISSSTIAFQTVVSLCFTLMGATWLRRGLRSSAVHTEDQLPRKYIWKSIVANDDNYALAA